MLLPTSSSNLRSRKHIYCIFLCALLFRQFDHHFQFEQILGSMKSWKLSRFALSKIHMLYSTNSTYHSQQLSYWEVLRKGVQMLVPLRSFMFNPPPNLHHGSWVYLSDPFGQSEPFRRKSRRNTLPPGSGFWEGLETQILGLKMFSISVNFSPNFQ